VDQHDELDEEIEAAPPGHRDKRRRDEGGFVLPWMALFLVILIAMAGFAVDVWNWWFTAQKVQRAADAGALAGVPFMPDNLNGGTPNATTTAIGIVQQNGYPTATVAQGAKANQLVVTVSTTVNNFFTSLLGVDTTTVTRSATAEFNAPVQMGSPVGHICNDPDNGGTDKHWCNIGAPGVDKHTGDRYADYTNCSSPTYECNYPINNEYRQGTYVYTVDLPSLPAGGADVQIFDPEFAAGNQNCNNRWLTAQQLTDLSNLGANNYTDASTRFSSGQTGGYCTGDDDTNLVTPQATAWLVRDSTGSQFDGTDPGNAVLCSKQFKGYVPTSDTYLYDLLDKNNVNGAFDADFSAAFHRWYTLCHVSSPGRYFIQVRSNLPFGTTNLAADLSPSANPTLSGQNRYSVRVVNAGTNTVVSGAS
jgi:hypothetical protein